MRSTTSSSTSVFLSVALALLGGCSSSSGSTTGVGTAQDALTAVQTAQTSCGGLDAKAKACLDTFHTCADGAAADATAAAACKAAFTTCMPAGACGPVGGAAGGDHDADGGTGGAKGDGDGDGPKNGGSGGGGGGHPHDHDGPGKGGHGKMGAGICQDGVAVAACVTALDACIAGGGDHATCTATAQTCAKAAIDGEFKGLCDEGLAKCAEPGAPVDVCAKVKALCAGGVPAA